MAINVFEGARRITKLLAALWVGGWVIAAFYVSPSVDVTYKIASPRAAPIKIMEACPADSTTEHVYDKVTQSGTKTAVTLCFLERTTDNGNKITSRVETVTPNPFDQFDTVEPNMITPSRVDSVSPSRAVPDNDLPENVTANMPQANDPREELIALRRMAELEDEAAKAPADKSSAGRDYSAELFGGTNAPETQPQIDKSKIKWDSPQAVPLREVNFDPVAEKEAFIIPQSDEEWIDGQWWPLIMKEIGWGALGAVSGLLFLFAFTWTMGWIARGFLGIPRGQDHR